MTSASPSLRRLLILATIGISTASAEVASHAANHTHIAPVDAPDEVSDNRDDYAQAPRLFAAVPVVELTLRCAPDKFHSMAAGDRTPAADVQMTNDTPAVPARCPSSSKHARGEDPSSSASFS